MRTNLHHLLEQSARTTPDAPALTFNESTLSYAELWEQAAQVATGLRQLGLRRGDRVGIFLDKRLETVAAIFGVSAAGGVFVPINPVLRGPQVSYLLGDCSVRFLVTSEPRIRLLGELAVTASSVEQVILVPDRATAAESSPRFQGLATHRWEQVFQGPAEAPHPSGVIDVDIAAILYTSGSTGKPKGVVLSHRNLIVGAESVSEYLGNNQDDVILAVLPLSFDAGLSQVTTGISSRAHVVLTNYLLPSDVVRLCAKHQVTGLTCVPPLWIQLAEQRWPESATSRLRYFANTGGRMPKATLETLRGHFPDARPFLMYGLTEAFRSTYLDPDEVDVRPDSIGKAIPNAEILVVRPDGSLCGPGEEGELVHRGALVAMGYWNDPVRTAERFRPVPGQPHSGAAPEIAVWSGDGVVRDEGGFLYFVGRKDEMIKTSGYRVSPTEIEEVAYDTGLVRDAVALGVSDSRLGQQVVLVVSSKEPDLDIDELRAAMKRALPLFMVPAQIVCRKEIPRSPNGKFDRALLRMEFEQ